MTNPINVTRSSMPDMQEYFDEIKEIWDTRWLTNMGSKHQQLEKQLASYLETDYITLYTNGHLALEYAIQALDLHGEIITTPFTFASTTQAIVRSGCTPVFCDIDPITYTLDPMGIESLITEKTSAILPVHVYGNICNIDEIQRIADKHNLKVIYDAAHAFGARYKGRSTAAFGDISMFSFHATKVFHTIEGGALTYADRSLVDKLDAMKNFGQTGPESVDYLGGNAKMNEFQAAMGICNLRHLSEEIEKRGRVVARYRSHLEGVRGIKLSEIDKDVESNHAYFPIVFDGIHFKRDEVAEKLSRNNIFARKYFYPLTNSFACYSSMNVSGQEATPVADDISSKVLTLPLYADLALADVDHICEIILAKD